VRRPTRKQIERVVNWLESIQVSLYGGNMDTETGQEYPSCMDYDVDDCIKRHDHIKKDTLWRDENAC
jgi:hypothetical protein